MSSQTIHLVVSQSTSVNLSLQQTSEAFMEEFREFIPVKGDKGDKGDSAVSDMILMVEVDGQTQFNVFANPALHALIVNGVEYHSYSLQQISGNWRLLWTGTFGFSTTDALIFRIFNT